MPHPIPPSATTGDNVAEAAQRFLRSPGGIGSVPDGIGSIANAAVDLAETEAAAELSTATIPLISAIAEALGISVGWVIFLGIIAVLALFRIVEVGLVKICDAIPWGFGDPPKAVITAIFHPLDVAENWCIKQIIDGATQLIALFVKAGELTFELFFGQQISTGKAPDSVTTAHMAADIATLKREYAQIINQIYQMNQELAVIPLGFTASGPGAFPGTVAPTPAITPSQAQFTVLTQRVSHLLNTLPAMVHDINVIQANQVQFSTDLNNLKNEIHGLEANLGSVRAIQFGVQDALNELTSTAQQLTYDYGQLAPEVQAHTNQLHSMHPLEQLLYLGQPGINNLKKLEENPCQCPAYPGLSGDMAGALALYEFITNG